MAGAKVVTAQRDAAGKTAKPETAKSSPRRAAPALAEADVLLQTMQKRGEDIDRRLSALLERLA